MLLVASLLLLSQLEPNAVDFERPIQTLPPSFEPEPTAWNLEEIPAETSLNELGKEGAKPLALYVSKSLLLPQRKDKLRYTFSLGAEIQPPKPIREWGAEEWKSFSELDLGLCEILLSEIQEIFIPPYVITARGIAAKQVTVTEHPTHRSVEFLPEDITHFAKLTCVLPLKAEWRKLQEALPSFLSVVSRDDPKKELPVEKESKTEHDFSILRDAPLNSYSWDGTSDVQNGTDFKTFMEQPYWRTQKGFDSWGYYHRAETSLGDGKSLRVEIRTYDGLLGRRTYPYDPFYPRDPFYYPYRR